PRAEPGANSEPAVQAEAPGRGESRAELDGVAERDAHVAPRLVRDGLLGLGVVGHLGVTRTFCQGHGLARVSRAACEPSPTLIRCSLDGAFSGSRARRIQDRT